MRLAKQHNFMSWFCVKMIKFLLPHYTLYIWCLCVIVCGFSVVLECFTFSCISYVIGLVSPVTDHVLFFCNARRSPFFFSFSLSLPHFFRFDHFWSFIRIPFSFSLISNRTHIFLLASYRVNCLILCIIDL